MKEEKVTISILKWLEANGWKIICYDFPQSGTGFSLHPAKSMKDSSKNKGAIIPDIIAFKNNISVYFENKDRIVFSDFEKLFNIKNNNEYENALKTLLDPYGVEILYYGIGFPLKNHSNDKISKIKNLVDFIVVVSDSFDISFIQGGEIFEI